MRTVAKPAGTAHSQGPGVPGWRVVLQGGTLVISRPPVGPESSPVSRVSFRKPRQRPGSASCSFISVCAPSILCSAGKPKES